MVEIKYKDNYEVADLAGQSVASARELFKADFDIPVKVKARVNGKKVREEMESELLLKDNDTLSFAAEKAKGAYLIGAMLLALAITGAVFAYGFTNASTTLNVAVGSSDFAAVSANTSANPSWTPYGFFKGTTGSGTLFDVDTAASGYTGDMVVTVSIANGDELVSVYRVLAMFIEMRDSANNYVDVNGDGINNTADFALLTLGNGSVDLFVTQSGADSYLVRLKSGFYVSNIWGLGWTSGDQAPVLYAEVAQR